MCPVLGVHSTDIEKKIKLIEEDILEIERIMGILNEERSKRYDDLLEKYKEAIKAYIPLIEEKLSNISVNFIELQKLAFQKMGLRD